MLHILQLLGWVALVYAILCRDLRRALSGFWTCRLDSKVPSFHLSLRAVLSVQPWDDFRRGALKWSLARAPTTDVGRVILLAVVRGLLIVLVALGSAPESAHPKP